MRKWNEGPKFKKGYGGVREVMQDATETNSDSIGKWESHADIFESNLESHLDDWEKSLRRIWFSTTGCPDRFVWRNEAPPPGSQRVEHLAAFYQRFGVQFEESAFEGHP